MDKIKIAWKWYVQTSALVGIPVVFLLLTIGIQKFVFTATCQLAGYQCEYAIGATDAMTEYMGDLLASNPGKDIVVQPRRK
jgi:hypothetical protein